MWNRIKWLKHEKSGCNKFMSELELGAVEWGKKVAVT